MAKLLFFGDIMGKPGRRALSETIGSLKEQHQPDLIVANVENLAHGKGVTLSTMQELKDLGIDAFTSGNHVFDKAESAPECFEQYPTLIRPYNFPGKEYPGEGLCRIVKNGQHYLLINLGGKVFFENQFRGEISNPFFALDEVLQRESQKNDFIFVDFHAEATSEKIAMAWHADGRITALVGTHTHVPTADARILPKGTATQTDAGMTGPVNSVIGVKVENALNMFLEKDRFRMDVAEEGPTVVNAVLVTAENGRATAIESIQRYLP